MGYVYRHVRLDKNEVFYIGIGLKEDEKYVRAYDKHKRSDFWNKIVNKSEYRVDIMFEDDDADVIKEKEKEFIKLYGRIDLGLGTLCNLTDGGDGMLGYKRTEEHRKKFSGENHPNFGKTGELSPIFGRKHSEETKKKIGAAQRGELNHMYGKKASEETKAKLSLLRSGKSLSLSDDAKIKLRERMLGSKNPNYGKFRGDHRGSKIVLDRQTGFFYLSVIDAHEYSNTKFSLKYFTSMLNGYRTNKTSYIYV